MEDGLSSALYDTASLFQYGHDDGSVEERVAALEQRVQLQDDEIQLLKSALADVVRRLNASEEQQASHTRKGPTKARPLAQALPSRNAMTGDAILPKKPSGALPSPSGTRKDVVPLTSKSKSSLRLLNSCKITKVTAASSVKRTNSTERISPGGRRESAGDAKSSRNRAGSTSSSSSSKKNSECKPKEPVFSAGKRRVTHCKVTVQVLMASHLLDACQGKAESCDQLTQEVLNPDNEHFSLDKSMSLTNSPSAVTFPPSPGFKGPKSPSSYFQLCY